MIHCDIYWADLPDRGGREQRGRRPVILWQDVQQFPTPTLLVIPLTSKLDALRLPATLRIEPSTGNGLASPSVALVFQLGACDVRRLSSRLGSLDNADHAAILGLAKRLQKIP